LPGQGGVKLSRVRRASWEMGLQEKVRVMYQSRGGGAVCADEGKQSLPLESLTLRWLVLAMVVTGKRKGLVNFTVEA